MSIKKSLVGVACAFAFLSLVPACAAKEVEEDASSSEEAVNAAAACNPLPQKTTPAKAVEGLASLAGIPLPALGPDASRFFHPPAGYTEGGVFAAGAANPSWDVPPAMIAPAAPRGHLRVVEWNVERGNKLDKAIVLMKRLNADVFLLNETDLHGDNSKNVVVAREIARALGYSYYTGIEFYERRNDRRGTSGNAIVSRYPLTEGRAIDIPMFLERGGYDWSTSTSEPRCGQRNALAAAIEVPTESGAKKRVHLVVVHTENKTNPAVRLAQFDHVVASLVRPNEPTILAGDLNTIASGEGPAMRRELQKRTFFDCSRGSDEQTFSKALVVRLRLDWMLLQAGNAAIDCPAGSYDVRGNDGASDHKPVLTEFVLK